MLATSMTAIARYNRTGVWPGANGRVKNKRRRSVYQAQQLAYMSVLNNYGGNGSISSTTDRRGIRGICEQTSTVNVANANNRWASSGFMRPAWRHHRRDEA